MNEENLPTPQEPPQVPRGKLWAALLAPPLLTGGLNLIIAALGATGALGGSGADNAIGLSMCLLPVGLLVIIICLIPFVACLRVRYHGRSVVLSGIGYFIGQVVICFAIWFGTCLAAFPGIKA